MNVDRTDWPVLSQLMDEWLELDEHQREDWWRKVEAEHARLSPLLREMLANPQPGFLEHLPALRTLGEGHEPAGGLTPGSMAGPYRLEREIGRGGMGVVWLATRADASLKRDVALKFPLVHYIGQTLSETFERERDVLARLEDARIARLYDAGVTTEGRPYLALEYVRGEAITSHCDRLGLNLRARLSLFLEVLRAVQYAHANLVVHRDLKPSNILVTAAGEVRLLDFGIAKLLAPVGAEETGLTRTIGRAVTPGYASPEQMAGGAITTATDVYSLGILLCELLAGNRPFIANSEGAVGGQPTRPSQLANDESKARQRGGLRVNGLKAALRGDLDNVILKAIEAKPLGRYATAEAFAQDIERYLAGKPLQARPVGAWHAARKFILRNKLAVGAAATAGLALVAGAAIALWQAERAEREAETARAVADFLQRDLLSQAGSVTQSASGRKPDPDIKIRTALDRASEAIGNRFQGRPALEAAIRQTIGDAYWELGQFAQAERQEMLALDLRKRATGPDSADTLKSMNALAEVFVSEGKYDSAETLLNQLTAGERRRGREDSRESISARLALASIAVEGRADLPRGEALYKPLVEAELRVLGQSDPITLGTMNNLAALYSREAKYPQAEEAYRNLIEIRKRVQGPEAPGTLSSLNGLGVLYRNEGKYREAEPVFKEVLNARRRVMGENHRDTAASMNGLGLLYSIEGRYPEAEQLLIESLAIATRVMGLDNPDTQSSLNNLAEMYRRAKRLNEAQARYQELLEARLRTYGTGSPFTANTKAGLGEVKLEMKSYAAAAALLASADAFYRVHQSNGWRRYYLDCLLGASLAAQGRPEGKAAATSGYQAMLERQKAIPLDSRWTLDVARSWAENFSPR